MACFSQSYMFIVCLPQPAWLGLMKRTKMWLRNERLIGDICDFNVLLCFLWAVFLLGQPQFLAPLCGTMDPADSSFLTGSCFSIQNNQG